MGLGLLQGWMMTDYDREFWTDASRILEDLFPLVRKYYTHTAKLPCELRMQTGFGEMRLSFPKREEQDGIPVSPERFFPTRREFQTLIARVDHLEGLMRRRKLYVPRGQGQEMCAWQCCQGFQSQPCVCLCHDPEVSPNE